MRRILWISFGNIIVKLLAQDAKGNGRLFEIFESRHSSGKCGLGKKRSLGWVQK